MPGISRAGSTIAAAMYRRVERSEAARFSLLLPLAVILGAAVVEGKELLQTGIPSQQAVTLLVGTIAAYCVGAIALKWLLGVICRGRLDRFFYYWLCRGPGWYGVVRTRYPFLIPYAGGSRSVLSPPSSCGDPIATQCLSD